MGNVERVRDIPVGVPEPQYFETRFERGWKLVSIEWERPTEQSVEARLERHEFTEPVPFGLEVASDCRHLTDNPEEKKALLFMMERIVHDEPLPVIANQLNREGFRNREGGLWTPAQVFDLLPRLIDAGPRILTNPDYIARKQSSAQL